MNDFRLVEHEGLYVQVPNTIGTLEAIDRQHATVSFSISLPYQTGKRMTPGDRVRINWATGVVQGVVDDG